jgi:hypothetical protein
MILTGKLVGLTAARAARRFEAAARRAGDTQRELLAALLGANAETDYGRRYGFGDIRGVEDYRRRVPIVAYEDLVDDMRRLTEGERRIFTAEDPDMFAQTSGTTGEPKFIPVTPSARKGAHADQMRVWLAHALRDHPTLFDGRVVSLVSPAVEGLTPCGLPFGSTSGHIYRHMPLVLRRAYAIPYDVFEIADYEAKYYTVMRLGLEHDVRFVATANPSSILKLCEKADALSEHLIADIRDGTLSEDFNVEGEIRKRLTRRLRPNPDRAAVIEKLRRRRGGRLLPGDYWPGIALIGCWKGGTVGHYLDRFGAWFDPDGGATPVRDWGYLASEGRMSIPLSDEGCHGPLTVASNFFEFVPVAEVAARPDDASAWTCLTIDEVEAGGEYYVLVTTPDGLYRYDINDIVRVEGRYHEAPEISFVRKGRGMTSLTGEKVSVNQIVETFQRAARDTGALADHFKAEADAEKARYLFRVEFATPVDAATQRSFLLALDRQLAVLNHEYRAKRDSGRLAPPVLHVMREGWYERDRRRQIADGGRAFQAKTELLSADKLKTRFIRPELEGVIELD